MDVSGPSNEQLSADIEDLDKRIENAKGISLYYNAEIGSGQPANPDTIRAINSEIEEAQQKAKEADTRVAKYTGGLLQVTGMLEADSTCD